MRRILAAAGLAATAFLLAPTPALACSCALQGGAAYLDASDAAFTGTVVAVRPGGEGRRVFLDVIATYKGDIGPRVEVHTATSPETCGVTFGVERTYLVFAKALGSAYETGLCDGTTDDVSLLAREGVTAIPVDDAESVAAPLAAPVDDAQSRAVPLGIAIAAFGGAFGAHVVRFRRTMLR